MNNTNTNTNNTSNTNMNNGIQATTSSLTDPTPNESTHNTNHEKKDQLIKDFNTVNSSVDEDDSAKENAAETGTNTAARGTTTATTTPTKPKKKGLKFN